MSLYILFWILICPIVGAAIGKERNNTIGGAVLGLVFGPLGWLLVLLDDRRQCCPECQGRIPDGARKCRHCGSALDPLVRIQCPACQEPGKVPVSRLGEEVECPVCQRRFKAAEK